MHRTSALFAASLVLTASALQAQSGPYKILQDTKVGGTGGWDYVYADSANRKLYIPRMAGPDSKVTIFDLDTLAPAGSIPETGGHGVVVDQASGHAFSSSKPVAMWDAKTLAPIKTIDVTGNPDGIFADGGKVYILSHASPNLTAIDPKDGTIAGTLDVGGAVEQAATDGKGTIYIDLEDKAAIAIVDAKTMKMTGKIDLTGKGDGCAGLAMDRKNGILFAACREPNVMVVVDAKTSTVITTLPIGKGSDGAVFNPATMEVYSTNGDGTLTVIKEASASSFTVEQTLTTLPRAKTLAFDPKTGKIFSATAEFGPAPASKPGERPARAPMVADSFQILVIGK